MTDILRKEVLNLTSKVLRDLKMLGISPNTLQYDLNFKHYSKVYYGRYVYKRKDSFKPKVFVYLFKNPEKTEMYTYEDILSTTVHEVCHHIQYSNPDFVRKRGVMHDKQFWDLYNDYMNRYFKLTNSKGGERHIRNVKKSIRKGSNPNN